MNEDFGELLILLLGLACTIGPLVGLLLLGLIAGGAIERKHLSDLERREAALSGILATQVKTFPGAVIGEAPPRLLVAEVVISSDYLKSWFTNLRKIFGGEMYSMGRIMERARREALLRLLEQAHAQGYNAVCNVRINTADISGSAGPQRTILMAPILATCTAYQAQTSHTTPPSHHNHHNAHQLSRAMKKP